MDTPIPKSLRELADEISLLIEYGAPEGETAGPSAVLAKYSSDRIALNVLHNFYSCLPEARNDGISRIGRIAARHGAFLLCASTLLADYLYLANRESAALIGPLREGLHDPEILEFFAWHSPEQFLKNTADPSALPDHEPLNDSLDLCPVCGTGDGEIHAFGCPVEVCPWCEGQLTSCQCRFIKTGRDHLSRDSHLDEFLDLLEAEGRIPFSAGEHRPSFPKEQ